MTNQDQKALITIALMAAFADGNNSDVERAEVKRVTGALSQGGEISVAAIYQEVILNRASLERTIEALTTAEMKQLAYELAVGVCDADGVQGDAERAFLVDLRTRLALSPAATTAAMSLTANAEAFAAAPLAGTSSFEPAMLGSTLSVEAQDKAILNYAILNGALELLPDTLASMAIIPLQMKMVYRLGKSYGFELDRRHIKEFLATAGAGMASQYVEQIGVKLVGKLFGGGLIGGLIGGLAKQSVSSGMSFATTYALGHLARRYYAGGRTFSSAILKDTYGALLTEAKAMQGQYLPAIRDKARSINLSQLLEEVRR